MENLQYTVSDDSGITLSETTAHLFILISSGLGLIFGFINFYLVMKIDVKAEGDNEKLVEGDNKEKIEMMIKTSECIQDGANTFLISEYIYMSVFLTIFTIVIILIDDFKFYTAIAFLVGSITSIASGYVGMYVATRTNVRVTFCAATIKDKSDAYYNAFNAAFRGGCVMGFVLCSLAIMILVVIIVIFKSIKQPTDTESYTEFFDYVAGYGLGGSTVALFSRVGGGIYTKAADVGADLVGKNGFGLDEDSPENPATIADNVGDNVGDIAGMGSDLFGSFAESTCAALVVSGTSQELIKGGNYYFPLMISAGGILVCIFTSFFATHFIPVNCKARIEQTLRWQLIISSILLTPMIALMSIYLLPSEFNFDTGKDLYRGTNWGVMTCGLTGLWAGMIIGFFTDYFTSTEYRPVQKLADSCKSGAAINIIQGLALGYLSCIIPMICLASK
jgi:inorganic pyrophosphatase